MTHRGLAVEILPAYMYICTSQTSPLPQYPLAASSNVATCAHRESETTILVHRIAHSTASKASTVHTHTPILPPTGLETNPKPRPQTKHTYNPKTNQKHRRSMKKSSITPALNARRSGVRSAARPPLSFSYPNLTSTPTPAPSHRAARYGDAEAGRQAGRQVGGAAQRASTPLDRDAAWRPATHCANRNRNRNRNQNQNQNQNERHQPLHRNARRENVKKKHERT